MVSLTVTLFSEKMFISTRCIHGFMPNSIKKSVTVSSHCGTVKKLHNFWDAEGGLLYSETVEGLKIKGEGVSK